MQKVYTKIESIVGNVVTVRASGVRSGDLALVGESYASVIKLSGDLVSLAGLCRHAGRQHDRHRALPRAAHDGLVFRRPARARVRRRGRAA